MTSALYFDIFRYMEINTAVQSLSALGETTRLTIFRVLVEAGPEGLVVGRIAERVTVSAGTLTFHLKTLVHAGLISPTRRGTFIRYAADFDAMNGLLSFLTEKCCGGHPEKCLPSTCTPLQKDHPHAA